MEILRSPNFKYWYMNNNIVMFKKKNEVSEISEEVLKIASNTSNTWQKDRQDKELINNTIQGKIAENMFIDFFDFCQPNKKIKYLSYDEFRNDEYKKHAPIDGIIYETINSNINKAIERILQDVKGSDYGKLTADTREYLKNHRIYTVEIKSSRIPDKDYKDIDLKKFNKETEQNTLIEALRERDFFTYPEFTRSLGKVVHNFNEYCEYVRNIKPEFSELTNDVLKNAIISHEIETKCDIYTRIFMDWENTESIIGYLTGYALRTDFFENPRIINMSRKDKSENALYYVYPIKKSHYLSDVFSDGRLWGHEK